jgi:hypothetical protein
MNNKHISTIVVVIAAAALLVAVLHINRLERIIRDQQTYIDSGCHGRYQGEGAP